MTWPWIDDVGFSIHSGRLLPMCLELKEQLCWIGEIKYENCFEFKIRDIRLSQLLVTQDRLLLTIPFLILCCITSKYWFLFKIDCFVSTFYWTFLIFLIHLGLRPRRITSSEISIIFHIKRKPNSIIVLLFIQNNS